MLKLLLSKYSDQQHAETNGVKQMFKIDKDKLDELKDQMPEATYNDMIK